MFEDSLPPDIDVLAVTAADATEPSFACFYDAELGTFLADVFSISWMEDSESGGQGEDGGEGGEEGEGEVGGGQGPAVPRLQVVRGVEVEVLVVQSIHRVQNLDNKQL